MAPKPPNPILPFLHIKGVFLLDGGLATALEANGCDLNDELWSAKVLIEDPELIRQVHLDYLAAGADCIATASYQASLPAFRQRGLSDGEGAELLALSVRLAVEARDSFWEDAANHQGRQKPLVAASIGPYGAYLADGSEYTGDYGLSESELRGFHRPRWEILAASAADIMALETIPSAEEARVLLSLLRETPDRWAWVSFSCRNEKELSDGGKLRDAVKLCDGDPQVAGVGINCMAPELVPALIDEMLGYTEKPILMYPNSGELYDADKKVWYASPSPLAWDRVPREWVRQGCSGLGGCCRVGPEGIAALRQLLMGKR
jgi:homocysteine S-methyltransferase